MIRRQIFTPKALHPDLYNAFGVRGFFGNVTQGVAAAPLYPGLCCETPSA